MSVTSMLNLFILTRPYAVWVPLLTIDANGKPAELAGLSLMGLNNHDATPGSCGSLQRSRQHMG